MFDALSRTLQRLWPFVLAAVLALAGLAAAIAPGMRFDFTPQALYAGGDDLVARGEAFKETFGYDDATVLLVLEAPDGRSTLEAAPLVWQRDLAVALGDTDRFESVLSLPTVPLPVVVGTRPVEVELHRLLPPGKVRKRDLTGVRDALEASDRLRRRFLSADGRLAAVYVTLWPGERSLEAMRAGVQDLEEAIAASPPPDGYRAALTGLPALRAGIVEDLQSEQQRLMPVTGVLFLVILGLLFRSAVWATLPLVAVGIGLAWTVGVIVLSGQPFNLITNILPLLLLILGTTNAVHIVSRYGEELYRTSGDRRAAAHSAMTHLGFACLLTTLTTAAGFGSLALSRTEVLRELAWQAAAGMGLIYVATISVLGATMWRFRGPFGYRSEEKIAAEPFFQRELHVLADVVVARPKLAICLSVLLIVGALFCARDVQVSSRMVEMYDPEHPARALVQQVEDHLGGFVSLDIALRATGAAPGDGEPGTFLEPDVLARAQELERFAAGQSLVLSTESYAVFVDAVRRYAFDEEEVDARQLREVFAVLEPVASEIGLSSFLSGDRTRARVKLRIRDLGTHETLRLLERLEVESARIFPPGGPVEVSFTGDGTINARAMDAFIRDLFGSLLLASGLIFVLMSVLLRSPRAGLVAALPNLTPLVLTLGYMGLRGFEMNAGNAIVFVISLGVAVDDTVHFLARVYEDLQDGHSLKHAVHMGITGAGRAMVITTILLIAGLAVLLTSDFIPNRRFAELTSLTMVSALVGDLILLPACIKVFWRGGAAEDDPATSAASGSPESG
jgi:predicted RND superfamily exporter protein